MPLAAVVLFAGLVAAAPVDSEVRSVLAGAGTFAEYERMSRAIDDSSLGWEERVALLRRRGALLSHYYLLESALRDFRAASHLAPHYSLAHLDEATVLTKLGRYEEAYAAFKRGFQANPTNLVLFMVRGMAYFNEGNYRRAERDFKRHLEFHRKDGYRMMWLALAILHQGRDGRAVLARYAAELPSGQWPRPLVDFYLGAEDEAAVDAALERAAALPGDRERHCEAYFFLGQWYRATGDEQRARGYFQKTVDTGVRGLMEYASARLMLAQGER